MYGAKNVISHPQDFLKLVGSLNLLTEHFAVKKASQLATKNIYIFLQKFLTQSSSTAYVKKKKLRDFSDFCAPQAQPRSKIKLHPRCKSLSLFVFLKSNSSSITSHQQCRKSVIEGNRLSISISWCNCLHNTVFHPYWSSHQKTPQ